MGTIRAATDGILDPVVAVPGQPYSCVSDMKALNVPQSARMNLAWYNAAGTLISRSAGADFVLSATAWTNVKCLNQVAPANTATVRVEVEYQANPFANTVYVDFIAVANSGDIAWTPGGSVEVSFVLERSEDEGKTWIPVYGYSRDDPHPSDEPVLTRVLAYDRASANGRAGVLYQAYALGDQADGWIYSDPTRLVAPPVRAFHWWLRDLDRPEYDVELIVPHSTRSWLNVLTEWEVQGATYPHIRNSALPEKTILDFACTTLDYDSYTRVKTLLTSKVPLMVQSNLGGMKWYAQVVGEVSEEQVRAAIHATSPARVRHMHNIGCPMRVVGVV